MKSARIGDLVSVESAEGFFVVTEQPAGGTQVALLGVRWVNRIPELNEVSMIAPLEKVKLVSEWPHSRVIPSALWIDVVPMQEPWTSNRAELRRQITLLLQAYPEANIVVPPGLSPLVTPVVVVSQNGWVRVCYQREEPRESSDARFGEEAKAEVADEDAFYLTLERKAQIVANKIMRRVSEYLEDRNDSSGAYSNVVYNELNLDEVEGGQLSSVTFPPKIVEEARALWLSAIEECLGYGIVPQGKPNWDVVLPPDVQSAWNLAASGLPGALTFVGGSAGTGKTHALAKLAADSARDGKRVLIVTWTRPVQRMIRGIVRRWGGYRSDLLKTLTVEELVPVATRSHAMQFMGVLERHADATLNIKWDEIEQLRADAAQLRKVRRALTELEKQTLRDDRSLSGTGLSVARMREADLALSQNSESNRPGSDESTEALESPSSRMRKWYSVVQVMRYRVYANKSLRLKSVDPEAHLYPEVMLIDEAQDLEGLDWFLIASLLLDIEKFESGTESGEAGSKLQSRAIAENIVRLSQFSEIRAYYDDRQDTFGRGVEVSFPFALILSEGSRLARKAQSRGHQAARDNSGLSATNGSEAASIALGWLFDGLSGSSGASAVQRLQRAIGTDLPKRARASNLMALDHPIRFGPVVGAHAAAVASSFKDLDENGRQMTFAEELVRRRPLREERVQEPFRMKIASSDDNMLDLIATAVYENWDSAVLNSREQEAESPYQLRLPISIVTMSPRLAWVLSWLFAVGYGGKAIPVQTTTLCRDFAEDFKIRGAREFPIFDRAAWIIRPPVTRNHRLDHWLYSEHKRRGLEGMAPLSPFLTISPITAFKGYETSTVVVVKEGRGKTPIGLYERREYSAITRASDKLIVIDATVSDQMPQARNGNPVRETVERYWPIAKRAVHGTSGPFYGAKLTRPWTLSEFQELHELLAHHQRFWAEDYDKQLAKQRSDWACKDCQREAIAIINAVEQF